MYTKRIYCAYLFVCLLYLKADQGETREIHKDTRLKREDSKDSTGCVVPDNPPNGFYKTGTGTAQPGAHLPPFSVLYVQCDRRYKPTPPGATVSVCNEGTWIPHTQQCALECSPVKSTTSTSITCSYKGKPLDSCDNPVEAVLARIQCAHLYEEPSLELNPFRACKDGSWDNVFPQCYPVCGQASAKSNYPWHVGIYNATTKSLACSGTIISERVIVSAARCFTRSSDGQKLPKEDYLVAVGKHHRDYEDARDVNAQYRKIRDVYIPTRYKGEMTQYQADVAVVVLQDPLVFSLFVQPICVDWAQQMMYQQMFLKNPGLTLQWNTDAAANNSSDELKGISVSLIPFEQCYEQIPRSSRPFVTHDKVCAAHSEDGQSVHAEYAGGGLLVKHSNNRYFITGVASTSLAPEVESSDSVQYMTYTLLSMHVDFIRQYL